MKLSVIIATKNEPKIGALLKQIPRAARPYTAEIIVVDASLTHETRAAAKGGANRILRAAEGSRGGQMQQGARSAKGEILCFLHADTELPKNFGKSLAEAFQDPELWYVGFTKAFKSHHPLLRFTAWSNNLFARLFGVLQGDHIICVRKEILEKIGGVPHVPLMEDILLTRRLGMLAKKRTDHFRLLSPIVTSSLRFYEKHGVIRGWLIHKLITLLFQIGVSPQKLYHLYYVVFAPRHAR